MPKVSIIVPVYNVETYLHECVDSLLAQTLEDIEIILVDDGSTDSSGEICDEYAGSDGRARVIHKANGGLSDARNAGLDAARGEYIGFVDGDDSIEPEMYEALYKACKDNGTKIAACDYSSRLADNARVLSRSTGKCRIMTAEAFFAEVLRFDSATGMGVWDKLYERSLFEQARFSVGKLHEDTDIMYRLVFQTDRISYLSIPYYIHFHRTGTITDRRYGDRDYNRYEANGKMFQYILANHPDLADVAAENHCISNLSIIHNMARSGIYDRDMYRQIRTDTRSILNLALKRDCLPSQMKLQLRTMCVGYRPYKLLYRLHILLKKKN